MLFVLTCSFDRNPILVMLCHEQQIIGICNWVRGISWVLAGWKVKYFQRLFALNLY
jgi:hypothetical protein